MHGASPIPTQSGPRRPLSIGFEATKHTGNILRLLEASHGSYSFSTVDTLSTVWHPKALCWMYGDGRAVLDDDNDEYQPKWTSLSPWEVLVAQEEERLRQYTSKNKTTLMMMPQQATSTPRLLSLSFSDDRTALVKLRTAEGNVRYLSILRLDENTLMNDGWIILREVQVPSLKSLPLNPDLDYSTTGESVTSLHSTLRRYLDIEHGGGELDADAAWDLFASKASLVSVGMDDPSQHRSDWGAPVGSLLEIPLKTYLQGVESQTPHDTTSTAHDSIVTIDVACGGGNPNTIVAAAATVRVGNGSQTIVFEDHLLLGREVHNDGDNSGWKILSKTFSPQPWPVTTQHHVHHHGEDDHHHHDHHHSKDGHHHHHDHNRKHQHS